MFLKFYKNDNEEKGEEKNARATVRTIFIDYYILDILYSQKMFSEEYTYMFYIYVYILLKHIFK